MKKSVGQLTLVIMLLFTSKSLLAQVTEVSAVVDRSNISQNETFLLTVALTGKVDRNERLDIANLEENFDVLNSSTETRSSYTNGRGTTTTYLKLTLAPKSAGKLLIPPIRYKNLTTKPITISVEKQKVIQGTLNDFILETEISKTELYIQEQVTMTYRLLYAIRPQLNRKEPEVENLDIVGLADNNYKKTIAGKHYQVVEFNYAVTPGEAGEIIIPQQNWYVSYRKNNYRPIEIALKTDEIKLKVLPIPPEYPVGAEWLATEQLEMTEEWEQNPSTFREGEPITRTITVRAMNLKGEQLPPIIVSRGNQDFTYYEDKPSLDTETGSKATVATRIESVAVVPKRAGDDLVLPGFELTWWNTREKKVETSVIAERTLSVQAVQAQTNNQDNRPPALAVLPEDSLQVQQTERVVVKSEPPYIWIIATAILAFTNILLALLWIKQRHAGPNKSQIDLRLKAQLDNEKQAFNAMKDAAGSSDLQEFRDAILAWAQFVWPNQAVTLATIAQRSRDENLRSALIKLDSALYSQQASNDFDSKSLISAIQKWRNQHRKQQQQNVAAHLKPLYA